MLIGIFFFLVLGMESALVPVPDGQIAVEDTLCFQRDILPIFHSNCAMAKCHDAITHKDGYTLLNYSGVMKGVKAGNATQSKLYRVVNENEMPPDWRLPDSLKARIRTWITQGALNNDCSNLGCDSTILTAAKAIRPFVNVNCLGCHSATTANGGILLETDQQLEEQKDLIACAVMHSDGCKAMPPNNVKVTQCELSQVRVWALGTASLIENQTTYSHQAMNTYIVGDKLLINFSDDVNSVLSVSIMSLQGITLRVYTLAEVNRMESSLSLSLPTLASGVYFAKVKTNKTTFASKFSF